MKHIIRWGIRRDLDEILRIEAKSFVHPWDEREFLKHFRERECVLAVAENAAGIMGYTVHYLHKKFIALMNLAVHPGARHQGFGRSLLRDVQRKVTHKRRYVSAIVGERNLDAQLFFRACGYECVNVLTGIFECSDDAGYEFVWRPAVYEECRGK